MGGLVGYIPAGALHRESSSGLWGFNVKEPLSMHSQLPADGQGVVAGVRRDGDDVVVVIDGDVDVAAEAHLRHFLRDLVDGQGHLELVLDLRDVDFMDSTGVRLLLEAKRNLDERGGALVLVEPAPCVRRLLDILGLGEVLEVRG